MSIPSSTEILASIANFRAIEQACKNLGVSVSELEDEPTRETSSVPTLQSDTVRLVVCQIINLRNLHQAVRETDMPSSIYMDLRQSIEAIAAPNTSHRAPRIYSSKEFAEKGLVSSQVNRKISSQGSLFDDSEPAVLLPQQSGIVWDDDGEPFG